MRIAHDRRSEGGANASTNVGYTSGRQQSLARTTEPGGDLKIEVATQPGRTQLVNVTMGKDADGDPAAFIWSKAGTFAAVPDLVALLRLNMQLTYGRAALRGEDIVILHALLDGSADLAEVGKAVYFVAKAADELERGVYGATVDAL